MKTFDDESYILENYRLTPHSKIRYFGRFFDCFRIEILTKSFIFSKSWIDSSSKKDLPPDFHNDKHHIMMEFMRVDDSVNEIDGKHVTTSFEKTNKRLKELFGEDYKKEKDDGLKVFIIPDTSDSNLYNFNGYFSNFERTVMKHSSKIDKYRKNYPKCKKTIFFVCDESNHYVQVSNKEDLNREDEVDVYLNNFIIHYCYKDKKFIEVIRKCKADYLIWMILYKTPFVNGKKMEYPYACIFDIKHLKEDGYSYNHDMMFKVKKEVYPDGINI